MSNEELALLIRAGDMTVIKTLWNQTSRFVKMMAKRYFSGHLDLCSRIGIELDDLIQEGYFAMLDAIAAYTTEPGYAFLTYLHYPLQKRFNSLAGICTSRTQNEPLNNALSFDLPIGEEISLGDNIQCQSAADSFEAVIEVEYIQSLHNALEAGIMTLSQAGQDIIRGYYYQGKSHKILSYEHDMTLGKVISIKNRALWKLRSGRSGVRLKPFRQELLLDPYRHTGLSSFRSINGSSTEWVALNNVLC